MGRRDELLSEVQGHPLPDDVPSLWQTFTSTASRYPHNVAISCLHQPAELYQVESEPLDDLVYRERPWLRWSYQNLLSAIRRLQSGLKVRGFEKGAPLFSFFNAGVEFPLCLWTSWATGCCFAPINPKNLTNSSEVDYMMETVLKVASASRPFIIAGDVVIAKKIERLPMAKKATKIVAAGVAIDGWESPDGLMKTTCGAQEPSVEDEAPLALQPNTDNIVFFTSGTTALPKGCNWKYPAGALYLEQRLRRTKHITRRSIVCVPIPNNHGASWYWFMPTLCQGGTVVYPSPLFDPSSLVRAMYLEKCTDAIIVPTMVQALANARSALGLTLSELSCISMAGSPCTPAHMHEAMSELGARSIENAWGMTENVLIPSGPCYDPKVLIEENHVSIGTVPDGLRLKICPPGEYEPVHRGMPGELHFSSQILTHEYIGVESSDFYDMDGVRWFKTGDQGRIEHSGLIFVVGRYKDMIVRGAENMAPAAIEATIATEERLRALDIQIVGAPDPVADEIPVVISKGTLEPQTFELLKEVVAKRMGPQYVPVEVFTLKELGLRDWPRTIIGKLQKNQVAALVEKLIKHRDSPAIPHKDVELSTVIRNIWARSIGTDIGILSIDRPISDFADSITVMRVRDRISKETGRVVSLASLSEAGTMRKQFELLLNAESQDHPSGFPEVDSRATHTIPDAEPFKDEDIVHVDELSKANMEAIIAAIRAHGLHWNDVIGVTPAYDFLELSSRHNMIDTMSPQWALICHPDFSITQVEAAVRMCVPEHPMFSSLYVRRTEHLALHVFLRHDGKFLQEMIGRRGKVSCADDVISALRETAQPNPTGLPGPLAHFSIFQVEDTCSVGVLMKLNHLICDAVYGQIFLDDLDSALGGVAPNDHASYKSWSDSYQRGRHSPQAHAAVQWNLNRLKDLGSHREALWPQPEDSRFYSLQGLTGSGTKDTYTHNFDCPGINNLRHQHKELTAPVIAKTAYALATVDSTNRTHALFANLEAARTSFPFVPRNKAHMLQYEATDVAGPCFVKVANLVHIRPEETLISLLRRMQVDQNHQTRYASAPWHDIMEGLGPAGDVLADLNWCSTFNWVPGSGVGGRDMNCYRNMRLMGLCVKVYNGLDTNCALEGGGRERMLMDLRGTGLDLTQMASFAQSFERKLRYICDAQNWEEPIGPGSDEGFS